jgi:hypothetical protein
VIIVRSAIAQRPGQNPNKLGLNEIQFVYNGVGNNILFYDARTLFKSGNNMAVGFICEGSASGGCDIYGSPKSLPSPYNAAEVSLWSWTLVTSIAETGTFYSSVTPDMYSSLMFDFSSPANEPVIITACRA